MVDTRFHPFSGAIPLGELLGKHISAFALDGAAGLLIEGAGELDTAGPANIALAANKEWLEDLRLTKAGVVIVAAAFREDVPAGTLALVAERPHDLFVDILERLYPDDTRAAMGGMAADAQSAPLLEEGVELGPNVVIGANVEIGRGSRIGGNTVIGHGVTIGRNCLIAGNVTIDCAYIGNNVIIHGGARIGTEGFGWLDHGRSNRKIPQLGRVIVQDGVEIGANSTIDRGALGDTVIGLGTKIDNLVQIGHNCRIGRSCLIASQTGLSGSTVLEDGVVMGGNTGTAGHMTIGAGSLVIGRAGVTKSFPAGSVLAGFPAQPSKDFWREAAALRRLSRGVKR